MAAPECPAQEAHRARQVAGRPRGTGRAMWQGGHAARVGSVREGIETINRGIYSPIYTHYFPLFSPCGTMFPHGLTCAGRVATYRTSDAIRTVTIAWTRVHGIVKSITCAKGDLSEDNRTTYLAPRGILRSS